jgi:hypothetical protein
LSNQTFIDPDRLIEQYSDRQNKNDPSTERGESHRGHDEGI